MLPRDQVLQMVQSVHCLKTQHAMPIICHEPCDKGFDEVTCGNLWLPDWGYSMAQPAWKQWFNLASIAHRCLFFLTHTCTHSLFVWKHWAALSREGIAGLVFLQERWAVTAWFSGLLVLGHKVSCSPPLRTPSVLANELCGFLCGSVLCSQRHLGINKDINYLVCVTGEP